MAFALDVIKVFTREADKADAKAAAVKDFLFVSH